MKAAGTLVKHTGTNIRKIGIVLEKLEHNSLNRKFFGDRNFFKVLWNDGTIGNNVCEIDLKEWS